MAAIQMIRKHGKVLAGIVGLALFAFVAEEAVRSMSSQSAEARQEIGEVCDETLHYPEFHAMVEELSNIYNVPNDEDTQASIRNEAWNRYLYEKLLQQECDKVGLMVTDAEMEHALKSGNLPESYLRRLPQYMYGYIFDQQTNKVSISQINQMRETTKTILENAAQYPSDYIEQASMLQNAWNYAEKNLRFGLLEAKFLALMQGSVLSNKVSAKMAFDAANTHYTIQLTALPYSSLADSDVEVSDADRTAAYEEMKEMCYSEEEIRHIDIINVVVAPSQEDREALMAEVTEAAEALKNDVTGNYAKLVRENSSMLTYRPLPVKKTNLPNDVQQRIDTVAAGTVAEPYVAMEREQGASQMSPMSFYETMNTFRMNGKVELPDSVQFRAIAVAGADMAAAKKSADSIVAAIKGGAPFDTIAARYNQEGTAEWFTGDAYEKTNSVLDAQAVAYVNTLMTSATGSLQVVDRGTYCLVLNVLDRRAFTTKYDVAIVKRKLEFSSGTYTAEYNKLSQFLAENRTADDIRANAANSGYNLRTVPVAASDAGIDRIHRTSEIQRWALSEKTEVGDVSKLLECGDNNQLLVAVLTDIAPKGYVPADNQDVMPQVAMQALQNKKAERLAGQLDGKTAQQAASLNGAVTDTLTYVSFANPVNVSSINAQEVSICGAVANVEAGKSTAPIRGNRGVYVATVLDTQKGEAEYDEAQAVSSAQMQLARYVSIQGLLNDLRRKSEVIDRRYMFY